MNSSKVNIAKRYSFVLQAQSDNGLDRKAIEEGLAELERKLGGDVKLYFTTISNAKADGDFHAAISRYKGDPLSLDVKELITNNLILLYNKIAGTPNVFPILISRVRTALERGDTLETFAKKAHGGVYLWDETSQTQFFLNSVKVFKQPVGIDENGEELFQYDFEFSSKSNRPQHVTLQVLNETEPGKLINMISLYGNFGVPRPLYYRTRTDVGLKTSIKELVSVPQETISVHGNVLSIIGPRLGAFDEHFYVVNAEEAPKLTRQTASVPSPYEDDDDDWGQTKYKAEGEAPARKTMDALRN